MKIETTSPTLDTLAVTAPFDLLDLTELQGLLKGAQCLHFAKGEIVAHASDAGRSGVGGAGWRGQMCADFAKRHRKDPSGRERWSNLW